MRVSIILPRRPAGNQTHGRTGSLAIDQGTSSTRAIGFDRSGEVLAQAQQSFQQIYPASGWVEHDPEVLWTTTLSTSREVLQKLRERGRQALAIGLTNQRETTVVWDRRNGAPLYNAIVWQRAWQASEAVCTAR